MPEDQLTMEESFFKNTIPSLDPLALDEVCTSPGCTLAFFVFRTSCHRCAA